jgi:hypothetical protein
MHLDGGKLAVKGRVHDQKKVRRVAKVTGDILPTEIDRAGWQ